ncbi:MAG: potassium channel protein [Sphingobacteriales bacterium]|nr:MAG: potassium channel protein [Sphingobacteriales bacterium]
MEDNKSHEQQKLKKERYKLLNSLQNTLETPMIFLGFVWLVLLIVELLWGLNQLLEGLSTVIWIIFIVDFIIKLILAPDKIKFLKSNIITLISLVIPALRVFRIARAFRVVRSFRLVKVVGSINRGMRSLAATMQRRAFGYVFVLTLIVICLGAAGMMGFEKDANAGFSNYGESLWWTAMLLTSLGSEFWPKTPEGKALCFLLALYGFAVFGYFTATLASFFMGQDASDKKGELAGTKQLNTLQQELTALRRQMELLNQNISK